MFPIESWKSGILRARELFPCSFPSEANPMVNHSSIASFHLLTKRWQGGEKNITHVRFWWAEKIRLANNLIFFLIVGNDKVSCSVQTS